MVGGGVLVALPVLVAFTGLLALAVAFAPSLASSFVALASSFVAFSLASPVFALVVRFRISGRFDVGQVFSVVVLVVLVIVVFVPTARATGLILVLLVLGLALGDWFEFVGFGGLARAVGVRGVGALPFLASRGGFVADPGVGDGRFVTSNIVTFALLE